MTIGDEHKEAPPQIPSSHRKKRNRIFLIIGVPLIVGSIFLVLVIADDISMKCMTKELREQFVDQIIYNPRYKNSKVLIESWFIALDRLKFMDSYMHLAVLDESESEGDKLYIVCTKYDDITFQIILDGTDAYIHNGEGLLRIETKLEFGFLISTGKTPADIAKYITKLGHLIDLEFAIF